MQKFFYFLVFLLFFIYSVSYGKSKSGNDTLYVCPPCGGACDDSVYANAGKCTHCSMTLINKQVVDVKKSQEKITICFYLQDGVEVLDFAGPLEAFSYAGFKVFTVSKTKQPIKSQDILTVTPDFSIKDAPPYDILAVFGGNVSPTSRDAEVIDWIKAKRQNTRYYFSVCTGAFIFGRAGLLDSLTATTFHLSIDDLRRSFPKTNVLTGVRFVDNGKVITTAGISAGIDGALHLIAKLRGADEAHRVAEMMEYDKWVPGQGLVLGETK